MKCEKCKEETNYHEHHVWCKCLDNPHGFSLDERPSRMALCKKCHDKIESEVIIPILKNYSLKSNYNSEHFLWKFIQTKDKEVVIKSIVDESWRWLGNGNT